MAATNQRSFLIDVDTAVWAFGDNTNGELGMGPDIKVVNQATRLQGLPPIQSIVCSCNHTLFLDAHATVWACGRNSHHQLGLTENRSYFQFEQLNCANCMWCTPQRASRCRWVWGCEDNAKMTLTNKCASKQFVPKQIEGIPLMKQIAGGYYHLMLTDFDCFVWVVGYNLFGQLGCNPSPSKCPQESGLSVQRANVQWRMESFCD